MIKKATLSLVVLLSVLTFYSQVSIAPFPKTCFGATNPNTGQPVPINLTQGTPAGGTFSGPGVAGNQFFPTTAGVGTHTITYTVIIAGIPQSATRTITVYPPPSNTTTITNLQKGAVLTNGGLGWGSNHPESACFGPLYSNNWFSGGCFWERVDYQVNVCHGLYEKFDLDFAVNSPDPTYTYNWMVSYSIVGGVLVPIYDVKWYKMSGPTIGTSSTIHFDSCWRKVPELCGADTLIFRRTQFSLRLFQTDTNGCSTRLGYEGAVITKPTANFTAPDTICLGQEIAFSNSSTTRWDAKEWFWDFGDGNYSTTKNPKHTFGGAGTFQVKLIAKVQCQDCADTIIKPVVVLSTVAPAISSCNSTVCPGATVTYSTDPGCSFYDWQVTNGTIVTGQGTDSVVVNWGTAPNSTITVLTSCTPASCPASAFEVPVLVPTSNIGGKTKICYTTFFGGIASYSVQNFPGATYAWSISPAVGSITTGQGTNSIKIDWANVANGTYQVNVKIKHPLLACENNSTLTVTVLPQLGFSAQPYQVCYNTTATYTLNQPGTFNWTVLNGVINSGQGTNSVTILWNTKTGNHSYSAKPIGGSAGAFCNDSVWGALTVDTNAVDILGVTGNQYVCPNSIQKYTIVTSNSAFNFNWTPTNGTVTTTDGLDVYITWGPAGPYGLSVTQSETVFPSCVSNPFVLPVYDINVNPPTIIGTTPACVNDRFSYKIPNVKGASYVWSVTPPTAGSIVKGQGTDSITIQFTNSGAAVISVATSLCASPAISNYNVTINAAPAAPVVAQTGYACAGGVGVGADLTSTGGYVSYLWSNGATGISTHIFNGGTYQVIVSDANGCTNKGKIIVDEKGKPNADISTSDEINFCPANPINSTLSAIQPVVGTYQWYRDGLPIGTNSQTYTATTTGNYYVIVTSTFGCPKTSNNITINDTARCSCIPITPTYCKATGNGTGLSGGGASADANGSSFRSKHNSGKGDGYSVLMSNIVVCDGVVNFTNTTANTIFWLWDFGDGASSNLQNPTHTYAPGFYQATYYALFSDSTWTFITKDIEVPLIADFTPIGISCNSILFANKSKWNYTTPVTIWLWDFGDGNTSSASSPTYTYSGVGSYTVTLTASNAFGCTRTASSVIQILPDPVAKLYAPNVCANSPTQFADSTLAFSYSSIAEWEWDFGDGSTSNLQNPIYTYGAAGTYIVTLKITDSNLCTSTDTKSVTVNSPPAGGNITASGVGTFCSGQSVMLTAPAGVSYLWSNGLTTQNITAQTTGAYSCVVTYATGCTEKLDPFNVLTRPLPALDTKISTPLCGTNTGYIYTSSGTPAYTYQWYFNSTAIPGETNSGYSVPAGAAGTYSVVVTNSYGCSNTGTLIMTAYPAITSVTISGNAPFCEGSSVTLSASVVGGTAPFTNTWYGNSGGQVSTATYTVTNGSYSQIQVRDANGCFGFAGVSPTVNLKPVIKNFPEGCFEFCYKDTFLSNITGATTYQWYLNNVPIGAPAGTGPNMVITQDGTYKVIAANAAGCSDTTGTVTIVTKPLPVVDAGQDLAMCFAAGESVVLDGSGAGTYLWTPSTALSSNTIAKPTANPNATTNYILQVTGSNGCKDKDTMQVLISCAQPVLSVSNQTICQNSCATMTAAAGGGAGNYQYTWSTGQTGAGSHSICTLTTQTVIVTVTDNALNTDVDTAVITVLPKITLTPVISNIACGNATGSALISASGSVSPYTYSWNTGSILPSIFNVGAGTYSLTATDSKGCTRDTSIQILVTGAITSIYSPASANCGIANGSIVVTPSGGITPYVYLWSNGTSSATGSITGATGTINSLSSGSYSITVTDASAGGCSTTGVATVTNNTGSTSALTIGASPTCFGNADGTATITVTGGTPNYSYSWNNGTTSATGSSVSATIGLTGLTAGNYTVAVTDGGLCLSTATITITQPLAVSVTASQQTPATCSTTNGVAVATSASGGSGGFNYLWSSGATGLTANNLSFGTYTVTATDINSCTATATAIINNSPAPTINSLIGTNISCNGSGDGAIIVNATGGGTLTYNWSTGSSGTTVTSLTNQNSGTYYVTVTDGSSCNAISSVTIIEPAAITFGAPTVIDANCGVSDGSATVVASGGSGGLIYSWSNNATGQTISAVPASTYSLTVTDGNACSNITSVQINNNGAATINSITKTDLTCKNSGDGSAIAAASGGSGTLTYSWSNGNSGATATGLSQGTYVVSVTDALGCLTQSSVNIFQPNNVSTFSANANSSTCSLNNGSADIKAMGGTGSNYTYSWSNGVSGITNGISQISNLASQIYYCTVTDQNNCSYVHTFVIGDKPSPKFSGSSPTVTAADCKGNSTGQIDVLITSGTAPYTYSWSNGVSSITNSQTSQISNLSSQVYSITITDNNGCTVDTSLTLTEPSFIFTSTVTSTNATCAVGGDATVNVSGGNTGNYSYNWSGGITSITNSTIQQFNNLSPGNYSVTITDSKGCTSISTTSIINPNAASLSIASQTNVTCNAGNDGGATATASGTGTTYTFTWSNGASSVSSSQSTVNNNLIANTYTVTVMDNNACSATTSVIITQPSSLSLSLVPVNTTCGNVNGQVAANPSGGNGTYTYLWSTGSTLSQISNLPSQIYFVTVTDIKGCTSTSTATINNTPLPTAAASATATTIISGSSTTLNATGGISFMWTPGVSCATCQNPTVSPTSDITYTVIVTDANSCKDTAYITINVELLKDCNDPYLPDAFSPNNDGENEVLYLRGNNLNVVSLTIFDRWGNKVFETADSKIGWNGNYNGQPADSGIYVYYLKGTCISTGTKVDQKGNITLLR